MRNNFTDNDTGARICIMGYTRTSAHSLLTSGNNIFSIIYRITIGGNISQSVRC